MRGVRVAEWVPTKNNFSPLFYNALTLRRLCQGSFFNGLFHGRGMLENKARNRLYFGEFEHGKRSGKGDEKFPDASRYKGEYQRGKRSGAGALFGPDGAELYRGAWHEDLRHGQGRLLRHRREGSSWEGSYDGDFFQDKFSGNGTYTYTDGTSIEGQWLDDVPRDGGTWPVSPRSPPLRVSCSPHSRPCRRSSFFPRLVHRVSRRI